MPERTDTSSATARATKHPRRTQPRSWRWPLSIIAAFLFTLWLLGVWGGLALAWSTGRVALGSRGLTLSLYSAPRGDPTGLFTDWHPSHPEWFHAMWWRWDHDLFALGCSLLAPAILVALAAAFAWYRKARPFARSGRHSRRRQFRFTRQLLTGVAMALLATTIASHWYSIEWLTPYHKVSMSAGDFWWTPDGSKSIPWLGKVTLLPATTPTQSPYFILYEWLYFSTRPTLQVSMWLVVALALWAALTLWYIRLRRYPFDGQCPNPSCDYDLTGLPEGVPCPECGQKPAPGPHGPTPRKRDSRADFAPQSRGSNGKAHVFLG